MLPPASAIAANPESLVSCGKAIIDQSSVAQAAMDLVPEYGQKAFAMGLCLVAVHKASEGYVNDVASKLPSQLRYSLHTGAVLARGATVLRYPLIQDTADAQMGADTSTIAEANAIAAQLQAQSDAITKAAWANTTPNLSANVQNAGAPLPTDRSIKVVGSTMGSIGPSLGDLQKVGLGMGSMWGAMNKYGITGIPGLTTGMKAGSLTAAGLNVSSLPSGTYTKIVSTLYGNNALAGAAHVTLKKPSVFSEIWKAVEHAFGFGLST